MGPRMVLGYYVFRFKTWEVFRLFFCLHLYTLNTEAIVAMVQPIVLYKVARLFVILFACYDLAKYKLSFPFQRKLHK